MAHKLSGGIKKALWVVETHKHTSNNNMKCKRNEVHLNIMAKYHICKAEILNLVYFILYTANLAHVYIYDPLQLMHIHWVDRRHMRVHAQRTGQTDTCIFFQHLKVKKTCCHFSCDSTHLKAITNKRQPVPKSYLFVKAAIKPSVPQ